MTTQHMWAGALSASSANVRARMSGSGTSVRLAVSLAADLSSPVYFGPATGSADNMVSISATGLTSGTRYYFAMEDATVLDTAFVGSFKTHPVAVGERASYVFGLAGDAGLTGAGDDSYVVSQVSNNPVFDTMRLQGVDEDWQQYLHLGDLHYRNIATATASLYRSAFNDVHTFNGTLGAAARQGLFLRSQGLVYAWDDHDFGPNDSDRTAAGNATANSVYRERVPHYALADAAAIYQNWQIGRVLYIASDVRSARDPNSDPAGPSKTMLGSAQKTWMEGILEANAGGAEALVWISPSRWIGGSDTWSSFADERDEMVQMFGDLGWLEKMLFVTADEHALGICSGPNNGFGGFPMFMVASMDSDFTTATDGNSPIYDIGRVGGRQQYGTIQVIDSGESVQLRGTGYINGAEWITFDAFVEEPVTSWLAGMRITAARLNDNEVEETTTTGAVAATGWSVTSFSGRKVNGITSVTILCSRTGAAIGETIAGGGNITDTDYATLPAGWRPPELIEAMWDGGVNEGGAVISAAGLITLRTTSGSSGIAQAPTTGSNVRLSAMWISGND